MFPILKLFFQADYDKGVEKVRVAEERHRQRMEKADGARKKLIEELEKREEAFISGKRSADGPIPMTPHQQAKKKKAAVRACFFRKLM